MLLCSRCQSVLPDGSAFCNYCGQPLQNQPQQHTQQYAPPPPQAPPPAKSSTVNGCLLTFLGICVLCGLGGLMTSITRRDGSTSSSATNVSPTPFVPATVHFQDPALGHLVVVKSRWETSGFGTVAIWRVTFKNTSDKPIGNIIYETHYYSETGGEVDKGGSAGLLGRSKTVQKVIPPKSSRTVEINDGFTHSQAHRADFRVVGCEFVSDLR